MAFAIRPVRFFTDYNDQSEGEDALVIPEDLTALSNEELTGLQEQAVEAFDAIYQGGEADLSEEDIATLQTLTEGIEALNAEAEQREAATAERREQAAELASRVAPAEDSEQESEEDGETEDGEQPEDESSEEGQPEGESAEQAVEGESTEEQPEAVAASSSRRSEVRVNLSGLRSRQTPAPRRDSQRDEGMRSVVFAAPDTGVFANGQGLDFNDLGRAVDHRLTTFNKSAYEAAAKAGRVMRQQHGVATIRKPFSDDLRIESNDPEHVEQVFSRATDQSRLPQGSLVASGGWCAPSETLYDLLELESRDGLFSLPEVNIARGGIRWTTGPDFATLMQNITGFSYTEQEDIDGDYDGSGGGSKPCFHVDCPDFDEARLDLDGLCITAGLLQQRGYPEVIARTVRGALVAHDHRLAGRLIQALVTGSDAVSMPADQVGATAPILTAIELQVEHYRDIHRLGRGTTLEAVFPYWVRGAVRADLSRRLGVDLFDVPDARIGRWFADRGIAPQFVYNWQGLSEGTSAADATAYPTEVSFLLYAAGTWVRGSSDIITLDTVYDSTLLGTNDYTALFTEEGWLTAKRGHDSRVVTVPITVDGATHGGVDIAHDGTEVAAV